MAVFVSGGGGGEDVGPGLAVSQIVSQLDRRDATGYSNILQLDVAMSTNATGWNAMPKGRFYVYSTCR